MSKATVTADKTGNVIGVSQNNPEYGYLRVEQETTQINDQGWLRKVKRGALIKGLVQDLIDCNYKAGDQITGKIVVRESLTPFNPNNPDRDLKIAGTTGVICRIDDQPIYRQTFFTNDLEANDQFIMHSNGDEIREVQSAQKELMSFSKSQKEVTL